MTAKTKRFTDRSRIESYQRCPRQRFIGYHMLGTGVRPDRVNIDILVGSAVHKGMESLLMDCMADGTGIEKVDLEKAVDTAKKLFMEEINSSQFGDDDLGEGDDQLSNDLNANILGLSQEQLQALSIKDTNVKRMVDENLALVELLIRAWFHAPMGLKWFLSEYTIIEVEQEDTMPFGVDDPADIIFMGKADGLLRRNIDNSLVILSLKTTKVHDMRKDTSAASDTQGMSEVLLTQDRYKETVEGVQMLYLLTSMNLKDKEGWKRRQSGVLRPWVSELPSGEISFAFKYNWTDGEGKARKLGKDWRRIDIWDTDLFSIKDYVESLADAHDDALNDNPLNTLIVAPPLYRREEALMERWERQAMIQEGLVSSGLDALEKDNPEMTLAGGGENTEAVLDSIFPLHNTACTYPTKCSYYNICWGAHYYGDDPLNSGFKRRVPHHEPELVHLQGLSSKTIQ